MKKFVVAAAAVLAAACGGAFGIRLKPGAVRSGVSDAGALCVAGFIGFPAST